MQIFRTINYSMGNFVQLNDIGVNGKPFDMDSKDQSNGISSAIVNDSNDFVNASSDKTLKPKTKSENDSCHELQKQTTLTFGESRCPYSPTNDVAGNNLKRLSKNKTISVITSGSLGDSNEECGQAPLANNSMLVFFLAIYYYFISVLADEKVTLKATLLPGGGRKLLFDRKKNENFESPSSPYMCTTNGKMTVFHHNSVDVIKKLCQWNFSLMSSAVNVFPVHGQHGANSLSSFFENCNNEGSSSTDYHMNIEWIRLRTFASFRCEINLSPIVLSRTGFYYTGTGTEMKCYSCGIIYSEWRTEDDPLELHRRISPNCRHLAGSDDRNIPIGHRRSVADSNTLTHSMVSNNVNNSSIHAVAPGIRRDSVYRNQPHSQSTKSLKDIERQVLAYSPVTNSNVQSPVSNASANVQCKSFERSCAASTIGVRKQHSANSSVVSSSVITKLSPLGVNFDKPRYPQYGVLTVRMSSYNGWPATQTPRKMAEAGFIYAGYADYSRCFFCGGGLRNWEEDDDPWIEHARWFPWCAYVRQNKGDQFVQLVQERLQEMTKPTPAGNLSLKSGNLDTKSRETPFPEEYHSTSVLKTSPSYQNVQELGYDHDVIQNAIQQIIKQQGKQNFTSQDILEMIFQIEEGKSALANTNPNNGKVPYVERENTTMHSNHLDAKVATTLLEENKRLKQQRICMICIQKDSSMTFLPCGHLVCCEECTAAIRKCPKCHQVVQNSIKTWLV